MNTSSTLTTAFLRAAYGAVLTGALAFLTALQQSTDSKQALIIGLIAALTVLATRGGLEGLLDSSRQASGAVKSSDVQPGAAGKK